MDILNEIYLIVKLCGDTENKYKIICKMGFNDKVIDVRTGRYIYIEGMYDEKNSKGLCCKNIFTPITREKVIKIINDDDIDDYCEYLDNIEKSNIKKKKIVRKK